MQKICNYINSLSKIEQNDLELDIEFTEMTRSHLAAAIERCSAITELSLFLLAHPQYNCSELRKDIRDIIYYNCIFNPRLKTTLLFKYHPELTHGIVTDNLPHILTISDANKLVHCLKRIYKYLKDDKVFKKDFGCINWLLALIFTPKYDKETIKETIYNFKERYLSPSLLTYNIIGKRNICYALKRDEQMNPADVIALFEYWYKHTSNYSIFRKMDANDIIMLMNTEYDFICDKIISDKDLFMMLSARIYLLTEIEIKIINNNINDKSKQLLCILGYLSILDHQNKYNLTSSKENNFIKEINKEKLSIINVIYKLYKDTYLVYKNLI